MNRRTAAASSQLSEVPIDVEGMTTTVLASLPLTAHGVDCRSRFTAGHIEDAPSRVYHRDEVLRHRRFRAGSLYLYREEAALSQAVSGREQKAWPHRMRDE